MKISEDLLSLTFNSCQLYNNLEADGLARLIYNGNTWLRAAAQGRYAADFSVMTYLWGYWLDVQGFELVAVPNTMAEVI